MRPKFTIKQQQDLSKAATTLSTERQKFSMALCAEHLDEAAFLYDQCRHILTSPSGPWTSALRFEQRLRAHLTALSIEWTSALNAWGAGQDRTYPGDVYTVARICSQNHQPGRISKILDSLAPDEEKKINALCNALIDEAYWHPEQILDILATHSTPIKIAAKVACDARLQKIWPLLKFQKDKSPAALSIILRLAGRTYEKSALPLLIRSLKHDDPDVCFEAALALLRMGYRHEVIQFCRTHKRAILSLGLAGGQSETAFLIRLAENAPFTPELLISMGLLGDIAVMPVLMASLEQEELSESAAQALELITAAGVKETVFIPDPIDQKELFKNELARYTRGEDPYPAGKAPGVTITRPSQNQDTWRQWFEEHKQRFNAETRYRNGKPCSPQSLVQNMQSQNLPKFLRQMAYEEMAIRYKKDFPFETDRLPSFQKKAIEAYQQWIATTDQLLQEGRWYLAGRLIT